MTEEEVKKELSDPALPERSFELLVKKMVRCEKCLAWVFSKEAAGFCKRRAPQPTVMKKVNTGEEYELVWPSTLKDDGCIDGIERG